jgi:hypothetical protein
MAAGSTYIAPSNGSWLNGNYIAGVGQTNAVGATTDILRLTGVSILPGTEAPDATRHPYIFRPAPVELLLCQRFYEVSGPRRGNFSGNTNSGTAYYASQPFMVGKRTTPTVTGTHVDAFGFPAAFGSVGGADSLGFTETRSANATQNGSYWFSSWIADARF